MVAGNDSDGVTKLWITSKLFASTLTVPLMNISISPAYGERSSKSRELTVESSYINSTSRHHIFIPLESALLIATFGMVNSTQIANQTLQRTLLSYSTLILCPSISRCASLGVYRIYDTLYTLCASSSRVCICRLRRTIDDSDGQRSYTSATDCRLLDHPHGEIDVQKISNIVTYDSHRFNGILLFALNNRMYHVQPAQRTDISEGIPSSCLAASRLQIISSKLFIYCTNNYLVEYDINIGSFLPPQFNNHLYFPCSETTDFSVNLTNTEISYRTNDIPSDQSRVRIGRFKFGECITHQNHYIFVYVSPQNNSLHILNSSMFTVHNLIKATCMNNEYARPLIIDERYIIAYDLGCQVTSVFDLQNITSPIINETDRPLQLASMIFNLSAIISIRPTATTTSIPSSVVTVHTTSVADLNFTIPIITPSKPVTRHTTATLQRILVFTPTTEITDSTAMTTLFEEDLVIIPPIIFGTFTVAMIILLLIVIIVAVIAISKAKK